MAGSELIKIMIVDDHEIVRDGLREIFENSRDFEVVGQSGDGAAAVRAAHELRPDVIIMDAIMPIKSGIEASREITDMLPETKVLILTASTEHDAVMEAVAAGATGYLRKHTGKEALLRAVRDVADGEYRIPADVMRRVFARIPETALREDPRNIRRLTAQEWEILALFVQGLSYAQIAQIRGNSPFTIRNTFYRIQDKLEIETKQELVVWAVQSGLLDE